MTINTLPDDVKNSDIEYCINEYVRQIEHRDILWKYWFSKSTISELAEEYHMSDTAIKNVIYTIGDRVLIKATRM